jgi:hypothetical protein
MQTFFVLGLIPGTNIQINFDAVLVMFLLFILTLFSLYLKKINRESTANSQKPIRVILDAKLLHKKIN